MSAISAASVGVKTMADGTLRITFDIEPSEAGAAFALFGKPGTPAALAALQVGYAAKSEETPQIADKQKGGPLSKEAAMLCQNPSFQHWAFHHLAAISKSEEGASERVRGLCGVGSRAMLDADEVAGNRFINNIRTPFIRWQRERATA